MKLKIISVVFVAVVYLGISAANRTFNPLDWNVVVQGVMMMVGMIGTILFTLTDKR